MHAITKESPRQKDGVKEFFDLYFRYIGKSEAPIIYHRWSILGGISALLSRNIYLEFGHKPLYPNLDIFLIGEPGARKSTAIGIAKDVIKRTGFIDFSGARTSPEKFIGDLEENGLKNAGGISQIFICEDEFYDFIGSQNENFISLLTKLWDCPDNYDYRVKNSQSVHVSEPSVQILGGCTHTTFSKAFPPDIISTGFLSRILLVHSEKTKEKIAWPERVKAEVVDELNERLKTISLFFSGRVSFSAGAITAIDQIYHSFTEIKDQRFSHYCSRRHTHLLKLCLVIAALEQSLTLYEHHVIWANTLLASIEDRYSTALGQFGKGKNSDVTSTILNVLSEADAPMTAEDIWKVVSTELESLIDLSRIIQGLIAAEKIKSTSTGGFIIRKAPMMKLPFTDFSLLHPSEIPPGAL